MTVVLPPTSHIFLEDECCVTSHEISILSLEVAHKINHNSFSVQFTMVITARNMLEIPGSVWPDATKGSKARR